MISIYAATAFEEVTSAILDVYRRIYIKINELTKLTDRRWPTVYPAFLSRLTNCKFLSLFSITSAGMVLDSSLLTTKFLKKSKCKLFKNSPFLFELYLMHIFKVAHNNMHWVETQHTIF